MAASRSSTTGRFRFCGWNPSPAQRPVDGAVIAECAAHSIIGAGASKQRIDLLDGSLRAAEPQLKHPPHRRRQIFLLSSCRSIALRSSFFAVQPCCCSHSSSRATWLIPVTAPPVISASSASISGAAACAIRRAASANWRSTQKPRSLISAAQHPQRLLCWRQRRQPIEQLALDLDILSAIVVEPVAAAPDRQTNKVRSGSSSLRGRRGFDI